MMRMWEKEELGIDGLSLFGHCLFTSAYQGLELHNHGNRWEFIMLLKGEEHYSVEERSYSVRGGEVFVSFPGQTHGGERGYQDVCEQIWFQIDADARCLFGLGESASTEVKAALYRLDCHSFRAPADCLTLARKCHRALVQGRPALYFCGLFLSLVTGLLYDEASEESGEMHRIAAYIRENPFDELTALALSARCGMSESGFKHKFKRETGFTPSDFINRAKIEAAKKMLLSGCTVTHTAMELGFSSSDYFSVVFKKYTRQTPSAYRQAKNAP